MKKSNMFLVVICLFLFTSISYGQTMVNSKKIDSLLIKMAGYDKMLGTIAISQKGKILYYKKFGSDIRDSNIQNITSKEYKYRIGSISKMFTAVMIFQLIEEKKLKIDDKLSGFFPDIPNATKITIDDLLNHHSGLFSFTNDPKYKDWLTTKKTEEEMLKMFEKQEPVFEPGEKCEYSNTNYVLLGYIIEILTGKTYKDELNKRIVNKIGLQNTYYGNKTNTSVNEVFSYEMEANNWVISPETDMSIPGGAGAIVSTPADLTVFINALFAGKLINQNSLEIIKTKKGKYGRGIFVKENDGNISYGHSGAIDGFVSDLFFYPDQQVAIAISYNGINCNRQKILKAVYNLQKGVDVDLRSFDIVNLPKENVEKYVGNYSSKEIPIAINIKCDNNQLIAQATNQSPYYLDAKSENLFEQSLRGIEFEFSKTEEANNYQFILRQNGNKFLFTRQ